MNITEALAAKGMELMELCSESGVPYSHMELVISGVAGLTTAQRKKVDNILGTIDWAEMDKRDSGLTVKDLRSAYKMSQNELAELSKVNQSNLSNHETKEMKLNTQEQEAITKIFAPNTVCFNQECKPETPLEQPAYPKGLDDPQDDTDNTMPQMQFGKEK